MAGMDEAALESLVDAAIEADIVDVFRPSLRRIMSDPNERGNFSVHLTSLELLDADMILGHLVLREPKRILRLLGEGFQRAQTKMLNDENRNRNWTLKSNVHARISCLPKWCRKPNVSSIRTIDVGGFLQFNGTVVRSGPLKVLEAQRVFICGNSSCAEPVYVKAAMNEIGFIVQRPTNACPRCRGTVYVESVKDNICYDYQEIRVQEQVQKLGMGAIPRTISVVLLHDLVDLVKAGDDVVITGEPMYRFAPLLKDERCNLETIVLANTAEVVNVVHGRTGVSHARAAEIESEFLAYWTKPENAKHPFAARDAILRSVCPQIHGLSLVKLAVVLTLISSNATADPSFGTRVRGDSHLLIVGDPGTGKSQILRYASKLASRSVMTTGIGTTNAGLTCAVVRDGGETMLEAGALVLADRGLCCIDEFSSVSETDRTPIHEAMEQQSLSVAKGGLVATLNTRCSIIAVTNPIGTYDVDSSISANTGISEPLLSRFDMVLVLLDRPDTYWDKTVSEFVLKQHAVGIQIDADDPEGIANPEGLRTFSASELSAYIAFVKRRFDPSLSEEAGLILQAFYANQRNSDASGSVEGGGRTTLRFLESLIRVSKAHARLMARHTVTVEDALVAVSLLELSLNSHSAVGSSGSTLHTDFPVNPDAAFGEEAKTTLRRLGLDRLIPHLQAQNPDPDCSGLRDDEENLDDDWSYESDLELAACTSSVHKQRLGELQLGSAPRTHVLESTHFARLAMELDAAGSTSRAKRSNSSAQQDAAVKKGKRLKLLKKENEVTVDRLRQNRFVSFSTRAANAAFTTGSRVRTAEERALVPQGGLTSCFTRDALDEERAGASSGTSKLFGLVYSKLFPLVQSQALILHNREAVLTVVDEATERVALTRPSLKSKDIVHASDVFAVDPLLRLIPVIARDLAEELTLSDLTRLLDACLSQVDVEAVERSTLALKSVGQIFERTHARLFALDPTLSILTDSAGRYDAVLGAAPDFIRRLGAEAFAYLIRRLSGKPRAAHVRKLLQCAAPETRLADGVAQLLYRCVKSVNGGLRSDAKELTDVILKELGSISDAEKRAWGVHVVRSYVKFVRNYQKFTRGDEEVSSALETSRDGHVAALDSSPSTILMLSMLDHLESLPSEAPSSASTTLNILDEWFQRGPEIVVLSASIWTRFDSLVVGRWLPVLILKHEEEQDDPSVYWNVLLHTWKARVSSSGVLEIASSASELVKQALSQSKGESVRRSSVVEFLNHAVEATPIHQFARYMLQPGVIPIEDVETLKVWCAASSELKTLFSESRDRWSSLPIAASPVDGGVRANVAETGSMGKFALTLLKSDDVEDCRLGVQTLLESCAALDAKDVKLLREILRTRLDFPVFARALAQCGESKDAKDVSTSMLKHLEEKVEDRESVEIEVLEALLLASRSTQLSTRALNLVRRFLASSDAEKRSVAGRILQSHARQDDSAITNELLEVVLTEINFENERDVILGVDQLLRRCSGVTSIDFFTTMVWCGVGMTRVSYRPAWDQGAKLLSHGAAKLKSAESDNEIWLSLACILTPNTSSVSHGLFEFVVKTIVGDSKLKSTVRNHSDVWMKWILAMFPSEADEKLTNPQVVNQWLMLTRTVSIANATSVERSKLLKACREQLLVLPGVCLEAMKCVVTLSGTRAFTACADELVEIAALASTAPTSSHANQLKKVGKQKLFSASFQDNHNNESHEAAQTRDLEDLGRILFDPDSGLLRDNESERSEAVDLITRVFLGRFQSQVQDEAGTRWRTGVFSVVFRWRNPEIERLLRQIVTPASASTWTIAIVKDAITFLGTALTPFVSLLADYYAEVLTQLCAQLEEDKDQSKRALNSALDGLSLLVDRFHHTPEATEALDSAYFARIKIPLDSLAAVDYATSGGGSVPAFIRFAHTILKSSNTEIQVACFGTCPDVLVCLVSCLACTSANSELSQLALESALLCLDADKMEGFASNVTHLILKLVTKRVHERASLSKRAERVRAFRHATATTELTILSRLVEWLPDTLADDSLFETTRDLLVALVQHFRFVPRGSSMSDAMDSSLLLTIARLCRMLKSGLTEDFVLSRVFSPIVRLLGVSDEKPSRVRSRESRLTMVNVLLPEILGDAYSEIATLMKNLNAYDARLVDVYDYKRRVDGYSKVLANPEAFFDGYSEVLVEAVLHQATSDALESELGLRTASSTLLTLAAKRTQNGYTADVVLPFLYACMAEPEPADDSIGIRRGVFRLLRAVVETGGAHADLAVLIDENDPEADFFETIAHIQSARRVRALTRLSNRIESKEIALSPSTYLNVLLPFGTRCLCAKVPADEAAASKRKKRSGKSVVVAPGHIASDIADDETRNAGLALCRASVKGLEKVRDVNVWVDKVLRGAEKHADLERVYLRCVCACLVDAAARPQEDVTKLGKKFLPRLMRRIKGGKKDRVQTHVTKAIVELVAKGSSSQEADKVVGSLLFTLCGVLLDRDQQKRDEARVALCDAAETLGAPRLGEILNSMRSTLRTGYQLHVLGYTLCSVMKRMSPKLCESSETREYLDDLLNSTVLPICDEEIFGELANQKDAKKSGYRSSMKEAKAWRSFDTFEIIARCISFLPKKPSIFSITACVNERGRKSSHDPGVLKRVREVYKRVAAGLARNRDIRPEHMLVYIHSLFGSSNPELRGGNEREDMGSADEEEEEDEDAADLPSRRPRRWLLQHSDMALQRAEAERRALGRAYSDRHRVDVGKHLTGVAFQGQVAQAQNAAITGLVLSDQDEPNTPALQRVILQHGLDLFLRGTKPGGFFAPPLLEASPSTLAPMLDALIPSLTSLIKRNYKSLGIEEEERTFALSIRIVARLVDKYNVEEWLPTLRKQLPTICDAAFEAMRRRSGKTSSNNADDDKGGASSACHRLLTIVLKKCAYYHPKPEKLAKLVDFARLDLEDSSKRAAAISVLRAVVERKVLVPEVYDVMLSVAQQVLTGSASKDREDASKLMTVFLIEYPMDEKRLLKFIQLFVRNLDYQGIDGRVSVQEMIHKVLARFPVEICDVVSDAAFIPLIHRLGVEAEPRVSEATAQTIKTLLVKISPAKLRDLVESFLLKWMRPENKDATKRVACRFAGVVFDALGSSKRSANLVSFTTQSVGASLAKILDAEESAAVQWETLFHALSAFERLKVLDDQSTLRAEGLVAFLMYPHAWVRLAASKVLIVEAQNAVKSLSLRKDKGGGKTTQRKAFPTPFEDARFAGVDPFSVLAASADQLDADALSIDLANAAAANLEWLMPCAFYEPELFVQSRQQRPLVWLGHRLVEYMKRSSRSDAADELSDRHRKEAIFRVLRAMAALPSTDEAGETALPVELLLRTCVSGSLREEAESVKLAASELLATLKARVGVERYLDVVEEAKEHKRQRREEKRRQAHLDHVLDPAASAQRKRAKRDRAATSIKRRKL